MSKSYNQRSLELLAEFIRSRGSRQRGIRHGRPILAGSIEGVVSTVKAEKERIERRHVTHPHAAVGQAAAYKQMRSEDGPRGQRKLSRGLRIHHFRQLALMGYDRKSPRGMVKWAAALTAHNLLLRGGELGRSDKAAWDPKRDIAWSSFDWRQECEESSGRPWVVIYTCSIKDTHRTHKLVGLPICRRASWGDQPVVGKDPLDTYDALLLLWRSNQHNIPVRLRTLGAPGEAPFFIGAQGAEWTTNDSKLLAREMGAWLDIPEIELGGKFARIGGATDMRELLGDASQALIKQRGRWASDVAGVYQRALVRAHLEASAAVGGVQLSRDMEEILKGWSQPASFR